MGQNATKDKNVLILRVHLVGDSILWVFQKVIYPTWKELRSLKDVYYSECLFGLEKGLVGGGPSCTRTGPICVAWDLDTDPPSLRRAQLQVWIWRECAEYSKYPSNGKCVIYLQDYITLFFSNKIFKLIFLFNALSGPTKQNSISRKNPLERLK